MKEVIKSLFFLHSNSSNCYDKSQSRIHISLWQTSEIRMNNYRIAIIGLGGMGGSHAEAVAVRRPTVNSSPGQKSILNAQKRGVNGSRSKPSTTTTKRCLTNSNPTSSSFQHKHRCITPQQSQQHNAASTSSAKNQLPSI